MGKELIKLSASLRVPRMAKDGEKGVGVVSANVLFAVGTDKNDSSDIKDADWKDTFGQLALVKGKFVWSCTKTTYTKGNPSYTGKYCLGECYDFAEVTEMYALSDNGTNEPADGDKVWGESYVATKGKYLWTCERVVYTQNGVPSYLNKKCITYFAKDGVNGTSFTPMGTAVAHYEKSSLIPSGYKAGEVYLVDANDTSLPKVDAPCVVTITKVGSAGALALANKKADTGDAYRIGTNLWVSNGTKWVDFGDIQGPKGDDGEDALRVECNPKQLVFSVNENGQIIDINGAVFDNSKRSVFSLKVYKGKTNVTNDATFSLSTPSGCNFTNTNDGAWLSYQKFNGFVWVYVSPNGIDRTSYKVGDANKDLPKTSSFVRATINYNGETTNVDIPLFVEFAAYNGDLENTIYGLNSHYESLSSKVDDQGAKIEENNSQIKQTAESVSTLVAKTDGLQKTTSSLQEQSDNISAKVEAVDKQGKTTQAELDMCVEKQEDGSYVSKMKVYANNISVSADHFLDIQGNYLVINTTNFKLDKEGNVSLTGEINATKGTIGGFDINSSSIGTKNVSSDRSVDGMLLTSEQIVFNNDGRQAIVGAFADGGTKLLGSFYDNNFELIPKYGVRFGIGGSMSKNVAIPILGGCIEGLAIGTLVSVGEEIISSTIPGNKKITLDRNVGAAIISTGYKYKKSSSVEDFETRSRDVEVSLPDMHKYDDGHIIRIKRLPNDNNNIYVHAKGCYRLNTDGTETFENTIIIDTNCIEETTMTMGHEGFAMTLIFFYDLITVKDGKTYKGAWVEWKNPRYWS